MDSAVLDSITVTEKISCITINNVKKSSLFFSNKMAFFKAGESHVLLPRRDESFLSVNRILWEEVEEEEEEDVRPLRPSKGFL